MAVGISDRFVSSREKLALPPIREFIPHLPLSFRSKRAPSSWLDLFKSLPTESRQIIYEGLDGLSLHHLARSCGYFEEEVTKWKSRVSSPSGLQSRQTAMRAAAALAERDLKENRAVHYKDENDKDRFNPGNFSCCICNQLKGAAHFGREQPIYIVYHADGSMTKSIELELPLRTSDRVTTIGRFCIDCGTAKGIYECMDQFTTMMGDRFWVCGCLVARLKRSDLGNTCQYCGAYCFHTAQKRSMSERSSPTPPPAPKKARTSPSRPRKNARIA